MAAEKRHCLPMNAVQWNMPEKSDIAYTYLVVEVLTNPQCICRPNGSKSILCSEQLPFKPLELVRGICPVTTRYNEEILARTTSSI